MAKRLLGSHWSLRIWRDGELWCCSFMCREIPELGAFEAVTDGVEKTVDHYLFGGKAKVSFVKMKKIIFMCATKIT